MSEPSAAVEEARALVQAAIFDDLSETEPGEDLRDYGLDSIRLMTLLGVLRERGVSVDFAEAAAEPTLGLFGAAIERSREVRR